MLRVTSTGDVSLNALQETFQDGLMVEIVSIDERQYFFKSVDAPSWITLIADLEWWQTLLGAGMSIYLSGGMAEAGKDTWRNKGKVARTIMRGPEIVANLAEKIVKMQCLVSPETRFWLGAPLHSDHDGPRLELITSAPQEIEAELVSFCRFAGPLRKAIVEDSIDALGPIQLKLVDEGLKIEWMDRTTMRIRTSTINS